MDIPAAITVFRLWNYHNETLLISMTLEVCPVIKPVSGSQAPMHTDDDRRLGHQRFRNVEPNSDVCRIPTKIGDFGQGCTRK
jgi:hypothetical protein